MGSEALPFVVSLPDCPRVQAAFCAGLLHPEGADRVIPLPSIKYGLEVVLPTLAEIPKSQALLKEGALLQPAEHPLLPDSQYSTFFSESLGGTRAGRLEKSHHTAGSVESESSPLSEASIVLEHVTWWVTRWEPFHHLFELANEIAGLLALKIDP